MNTDETLPSSRRDLIQDTWGERSSCSSQEKGDSSSGINTSSSVENENFETQGTDWTPNLKTDKP
jgi:hypothetical protein